MRFWKRRKKSEVKKPKGEGSGPGGWVVGSDG